MPLISLTVRPTVFEDQLRKALTETGATLAFHAIGGGGPGSTILQTMERVAVAAMGEYSCYRPKTFKQLYIYGALDLSPVRLTRTRFGSA